MPWVNSAENGSSKPRCPVARSPRVKKRAYKRCSTACSMPPMYWSTGSHLPAALPSIGTDARGAQNRAKYHDESTNVSRVSVSRRAACLHFGQGVFFQVG